MTTTREFAATGGAQLGWINATWPLANLSVSAEKIELRVGASGKYIFRPESVVDISRYTFIPVLGWGIRIRHCVAAYPDDIVFWCLGNPDKLMERIRETGFGARAAGPPISPRRGSAIRGESALIAGLEWIGLIALDVSFDHRSAIPGLSSMLVPGLLFAISIATSWSNAFQRLILKQGRDVGEIRPALNLLMIASGILLVGIGSVFVVWR